MIRHRKTATLAALAVAATAAHADVVWPALYLEIRSFAWWAISAGLLAEWLVVRRTFRLTWSKSAVATVVANFVSSVAGIVLIPLAGIAWEFFPGALYMRALNWGTFNPVTWLATFMIATFINTVIEAGVYKRAFKFQVDRRTFWLVFLANALSVGMVFGSLFVVPYEP